MSDNIPVIDLFAGPGGLGEGFSAYRRRRKQVFEIIGSAEKESSAHQTLQLRAFFRQFGSEYPMEYSLYVRGLLSREDLFRAHPQQAQAAVRETLNGPLELGTNEGNRTLAKYLRKWRREHDDLVVIGGPPCQAYSLVGRARNKGTAGYIAEQDDRHFLYLEYLRTLSDTHPVVFVMENVKGILSSQVHGTEIFPRILDDLAAPSVALRRRGGPRYRLYSLVTKNVTKPSDYVVRSEEFGVPQARHRVIVLGVRDDIRLKPGTLLESGSTSTVATMLRDIPPLRSGLSKEDDSHEEWVSALKSCAPKVARALETSGLDGRVALNAVERAARWQSRGGSFVPTSRPRVKATANALRLWLSDPSLSGVLNHEARGHIRGDLARYLFASCFATTSGTSPRAQDFPRFLAPKHINWGSGKFVDRFKVQIANTVASTITSHIAKDGHYFIHHDPSQCRSLTVREAARLQTFPDNYFFEGTRTQQYVQVGNAVPPWLALQIAEIVFKLIRDS